MNAITKEEQTALTLPERAAVALGESANEAKLRELVAKSAGIVSVTNPDGREEAHRAGMVLLKTRTGIEKTGKTAREDAQAFSKAVIAMEKDLIGIIQPEETRVLALRDGWDEQIAAEKAAKIAAERARTDEIKARIEVIRQVPFGLRGKTAAEIEKEFDQLRCFSVGDDFAEFKDDASQEVRNSIDLLAAMLQERQAAEAATIAAEEARKAEALRIEQERATLAAQRVEQERVANEQAAAAKRLADQEAAQALAAKQLADKAAANLKAERDAQELAMRLECEKAAKEQAERDRVAADTKRQLDEQAATLAAERKALNDEREAARVAREAALRLNDDHELAIATNIEFDTEARRIQLQIIADQALADARALPANVSELMSATLPRPESFSVRDAHIDEAADEGLADEDIIAFGAEFGLGLAELATRLEAFTVYARAELLVAA